MLTYSNRSKNGFRDFTSQRANHSKFLTASSTRILAKPLDIKIACVSCTRLQNALVEAYFFCKLNP